MPCALDSISPLLIQVLITWYTCLGSAKKLSISSSGISLLHSLANWRLECAGKVFPCVGCVIARVKEDVKYRSCCQCDSLTLLFRPHKGRGWGPRRRIGTRRCTEHSPPHHRLAGMGARGAGEHIRHTRAPSCQTHAVPAHTHSAPSRARWESVCLSQSTTPTGAHGSNAAHTYRKMESSDMGECFLLCCAIYPWNPESRSLQLSSSGAYKRLCDP